MIQEKNLKQKILWHCPFKKPEIKQQKSNDQEKEGIIRYAVERVSFLYVHFLEWLVYKCADVGTPEPLFLSHPPPL